MANSLKVDFSGGVIWKPVSYNGDSSGNDTFAGPDSISTWDITGKNDGSVGKASFVGDENLTGGSVTDTFMITTRGIRHVDRRRGW